MAESLTDKLKLSKRDTGDINWGQGANANLDAVDQHAQQATLRPPRTLSASLGSGAVGANLLGSTTYFYKITAVNAAGETTEGKIPAVIEAQVTESASPVPVILSWETVKGATGYKIYKSTLSGQEKFLASVVGESTAIYTDDGNTAVNGAISVPAANTARTSVSKIVAGANVTVTPPDGTGEVTINAASAAPPDASTTVKGVSKLSAAPTMATDPIAVGDNDPRNANARTPTGAAAGDLSATYPNPTVAKVNGTSVPASPSAGQILTATGPTAATWQTPAGSYAATVTVAAPSGVAATDTANVLAALVAANAAGGGIVLLREGTYLINSTLTLGANVSIVGQGKNATTIQATTSVGATALIAMPNSESGLRDLCLDFNGATRGGNTVSDITVSGSNTFLDTIRTTRPNSTGIGLTAFLSNTVANSAGAMVCTSCEFNFNDKRASFYFAVTNGSFLGCSFNISALSFSLMTDGAANSNVNVEGCSIVITTLNGISSLFQTNFASQWVIAGNAFWITAGASGTASGIDMNQPSNRASVTGNIANSTLCGAIGGSAQTTISGNAGFNGYTGSGGTATSSTRVGNDTLTFNGVAVSPTAPTTGQVLTATGAAAASWQAPTPGGYATVVVAAPTGVAATDTANIQAALNSIPVAIGGAGGGVVILRQGIYVVNQITIFNEGTKLSGSGPGFTTNRDSSPGSSLQAANPLSADMLVILASQVLVENISFKGFGLAAGFALVSGNLGNVIFRDCAFVDIKAGNIGIKATTGQDLKILDCMFQIHEQIAQTVARTPIAIKVGAALGGFSQNVDIIGNHFMIVVEVSPTGAGSIVGKAIEMTKVFKAVIERNQIEGNSGFVLVTGVTTIGVELFTDGSAESKGVVIGNNSGRSLNNFIRQTTAFPKVTVCGNSYIKHVGSAPAIDLASGNIDWAIVGNVIEATTGINFQAGADNNMAVANKASVADAGSGNVVASSFVTGLRKLGEASALLGDVKLEAGVGITLTQDAPNNKITVAAAGGAGNWTLVANLTNTAFGQTFTPDFTGLSLATHRSYMLMFELSLSSGGAGPNWVALRLNGAAPTTLQQYMLTDQQGVTQDDEGSTFAMAKILKVFPGGGSSVEVSGCIIITGKVNAGFPHAVGWYTITNQSAVEQMHRGQVGLRMNLGSGVDLTSLGLFSNADLNFLVAGSCRMSLYQAQ